MLDPLSEVFRSVRLTGGIFLDGHFTAPWCVLTNVRSEDCEPFLAAPTQIIAYHFVVEGSLFVGVEGAPAMKVRGGEIVLLPRNDPHTLASGPGLEPKNARDLIQPASAVDWLGFHMAEAACCPSCVAFSPATSSTIRSSTPAGDPQDRCSPAHRVIGWRHRCASPPTTDGRRASSASCLVFRVASR
jgi:hypothetical protein